MAEKLDPFDVAALEKSVNDSATRVSAIWVSFLIFTLYLLVAAATVGHRQLFLAEPVKLPVLNIELPLWGFFFLAPILFVIFHAYVLLQVLLLGRTAAAYNEAIEQRIASAIEAAHVRQRLANTLFAQIFAGSPREREGWLGTLLKMMAWITLAAGPIFTLLMFQFAFLPYHSHLATWTHRALILTELAVILMLWPLVLDTRRDLAFSLFSRQAKKLDNPKPQPRYGAIWRMLGRIRLNTRFVPRAIVFLGLPAVSLGIATFPSEPHVKLIRSQFLLSRTGTECHEWFSSAFDRLHLASIDVIDDERLRKIQDSANDRDQPPHLSERTRNFAGRDLTCSDLRSADLRHVDLTKARLAGANLDRASLQGASLGQANLKGASFFRAELNGANLNGVQAAGAEFNYAKLQNAQLLAAQLQGASFFLAEMQGARLRNARLQGAALAGAKLQGASLHGAQLQGAALGSAELQAASLRDARLEGSDLEGARLQGASLRNTQLQGASLRHANLDHTLLSGAWVWQAKGADCMAARVTHQNSMPRIWAGSARNWIPATMNAVSEFIELAIGEIPDEGTRKITRERMHAGLEASKPWADGGDELNWQLCRNWAGDIRQEDYERGHAQLLLQIVCNAEENGSAIVHGIMANWLGNRDVGRAFEVQLANGLLGRNEPCNVTTKLDSRTKERLEAAIRRPS